ncbi:S8 family serine peptidase [Chitinimonas lacunae]|uniref:S8 family serine peptidase n=1 Tax=Chitinimonas lacunae TaxID=1963018 RepID=A0ABV8MW35_9NEIS
MTVKRISLLIAMLAANGVWAADKLDLDLGLLANREFTQSRAAHKLYGDRAEAAPVRAIVRVEGEGLAQLKALGVKVRTVVGDIATIEVPANRVAQLNEVPGLVYAEAARPMKASLSESVAATGASKLYNWDGTVYSGATGKNVIVGVVDTGVDYRHPDFLKADGTTRLLGLWDMDAQGTGYDATFDYGVFCTPSMLNLGIAEGRYSTSCTHRDTQGHGTHVVSTAAGNGNATPAGQPRMAGVAPNADLLVASLGANHWDDASILDAVALIKTHAAKLGRPAVVNLSLGGLGGPRDGTSNFERGMSALTGPGFVIVAAAGNESNDQIRATAPIAQGETVTTVYYSPLARSRIDMWYPGANSYATKLQAKVDGKVVCETEFVPAGATKAFESTCGTVVIRSGGVQAGNDDRQLIVQVLDNRLRDDKKARWEVLLRGDTVAPGSRISLISLSDGAYFTSNVEVGVLASGRKVAQASEVIGSPASAHNVLSVAAYNVKATNGWDNAVGELATFSSRGPRRQCSNAFKCPPATKPEISAPGVSIMAAGSYDYSASVSGKYSYISMSGTSMASPHVAGAVALLLEKNPELTPAEVRELLLTKAQANSFTGKLPVYSANTWLSSEASIGFGFGLLDVAGSMPAVPAHKPMKITAAASKTAQGDQLVATIEPKRHDLGKQVNVYVAARLGSGEWYMLGAKDWTRLAWPVSAVKTVIAGERIEVPVFSGLDLAQFKGTEIYVGYGASFDDMRDGAKFDKVFTAK